MSNNEAPSINEIRALLATVPTPYTLAVRRSEQPRSGHEGYQWPPVNTLAKPANGYDADPYRCGAGLYGWACDDRANRMTHTAHGDHWTVFAALPSEDGRSVTDHGNKISCGMALPLYRGNRQSVVRIIRALGGTPPAALSPVRPAYLGHETGREPHARSRPWDGIEAIGWIVAAAARARGDLIDRLVRANWPKKSEILSLAGQIGLGTPSSTCPAWSPIPGLDIAGNVRWHLWGGGRVLRAPRSWPNSGGNGAIARVLASTPRVSLARSRRDGV